LALFRKLKVYLFGKGKSKSKSGGSVYELLAHSDSELPPTEGRTVMVVGLPSMGKTYMVRRLISDFEGESLVINARDDDRYGELSNCVAMETFSTKEFISFAKGRLCVVEDLAILIRKSSAIKDITAFMSVVRHHSSRLILVSQTVDDLKAQHLRFVRILVIFRSNLSERKLRNLLPNSVAHRVKVNAQMLDPHECFIIDLDSMTRTETISNNDAHSVLMRAIREVQRFRISLTNLKKRKHNNDKPKRKKKIVELYKMLKDTPPFLWDLNECAKKLDTSVEAIYVMIHRLRKKGLLK